MLRLPSRLPVAVATDRSRPGSRAVAAELATRPDVVVFDFPHSAVLAPGVIDVPSVLFTHNIESEIFRRHVEVAGNPVFRALWRDQLRKMERFERETLRRFDTVVAVSERDAAHFRERLGIARVSTIPTGVDLDHFAFAPPVDDDRVVFLGSMDWIANADGVEHFLESVWPEVARRRPAATMTVVGRAPPERLVRRAAGLPWRFTGFVEDVRPWIRGASACVIPLRVGGGTRIKAFEAMAAGCPVVSTSVGVEGLPVEPGRHCLCADAPSDFAEAVVSLLGDPALRQRIASAARELAGEFGSDRAARAFEAICLETCRDPTAGPPRT
jgi:glycosyltransferase involved in cell wall biosynthesis